MSPRDSFVLYAKTRKQLGNVQFRALLGQFDLLKSTFTLLSDIEGYESPDQVPIAAAAAITLKHFDYRFPENVLCRWPLRERLLAVYALIGCRFHDMFAGADIQIDFQSDLPIHEVLDILENNLQAID